jgi:dTDP-4-dehydrorhamnose 3,5-epimerase
VAHVRLVDLREGSPSRLATASERIDAAPAPAALALPPGVAHGFFAETEVLLLYLVNAYYQGDDEHGLAWDDPELGLAWPSGSPVLSDRDRANPTLAEVLAGGDPPRYEER